MKRYHGMFVNMSLIRILIGAIVVTPVFAVTPKLPSEVLNSVVDRDVLGDEFCLAGEDCDQLQLRAVDDSAIVEKDSSSVVTSTSSVGSSPVLSNQEVIANKQDRALQLHTTAAEDTL